MEGWSEGSFFIICGGIDYYPDLRKDKAMLLYQYLIQDLLSVLQYLPAGILAAALILAMVHCLKKYRASDEYGDRMEKRPVDIPLFLLLVYLASVLQLALFSREPGSRTGLDLALFATWGGNARSRSYVIENIIMFLPFGFLLPQAIRWSQRFWRCVGAGLLCSLILEIMQFLTERGHAQTDDVVTNALGTALGYGIYRIWTWQRARKIIEGKQ